MKRFITISFIWVLAQMSFAQNLLTEDFTFSGAILGSNSWATTGTYTGPALSTGAGLTYAGFSGSAIGNGATLTANGEDLAKPLTSAVTTGKLYMTFMVNVSASSATGDYITGLTSGTSFTNFNLRIYVKTVAGGIDFGVSRGSVTTAPATAAVFTGNTYNLNQTYLITCRYEFITPGTTDDVCSIFVHPTMPNLIEPATMSASQSGSTGTTDATSIGAIYISQGSAANLVAAVVDGFRVSTVWAATIPVELTNFTAQKANTAAKLIWSTATELNNARYDIERSSNGKTFNKIGEILGYGNSNQVKTYTFMDEKPNASINYYRLRQVDFDGKETISKAVSVNFDKNASIKVYPSVAKDKINIDITGDGGAADLSITNLLGQVVLTQKLPNTEGPLSVNINELASGSYIVRIISKGNELTQRFEKQ